MLPQEMATASRAKLIERLQQETITIMGLRSAGRFEQIPI
jgi:hypothetical protein